MSSAAEIVAIADRLFAAIAGGRVDEVDALYAPDVRVWHGTTGAEQTKAENLRTLRWVTRNVRDLRYEEIRREVFPSGFVQQHVLRGVGPGGDAVEIHACLVVRVRDGRIARIDEYLDSARLAPLFGPPKAHAAQ